ncbi:TNR16-like protein [Mya arenaria]|uniref:TNR16-like protein n=1 Tax=Mya arenaria TaxID=6604 RepID=A0ABY7FGI8_MYAAR|nr:TNR16-like protein [Mya arenaria]
MVHTCAFLYKCSLYVIIYFMEIHDVMGALPFPISQRSHSVRPNSCPSGKYYDEETKGRGKCKKCFVCPKGYTEKSPCSMNANRSCKPCTLGTTFSDKRGGICRNCTVCESGQFIRRQCLPYKDTRCRNCTEGKYALDGKGFWCKYCSVCKDNEEEVSPCTPLQNRECRIKEENSFNTTNPWNTQPDYTTDFNFSTRLVLFSLLWDPYI